MSCAPRAGDSPGRPRARKPAADRVSLLDDAREVSDAQGADWLRLVVLLAGPAELRPELYGHLDVEGPGTALDDASCPWRHSWRPNSARSDEGAGTRPVGSVLLAHAVFSDPDGNGWVLQQITYGCRAGESAGTGRRAASPTRTCRA
jgi:hypothetical protein